MFGYLAGGGNADGAQAIWGPNASIADEMMHHTMAYGTLGYPYNFTMPPPAYPTYAEMFNTQDGYVGSYQDYPASPQLGCCDWCSDDRLGGELLGLGDCPGASTVIVESTPISPWVWIIAAAWAALMLLKK